MTDPIVRMEPAELSVEPGAQVRSVITVRNLGSIVESFRISVVDEDGGGPASWSVVEPVELAIYPQQESSAVLIFSPPPGWSAPSGTFPFSVLAVSSVDPAVSAATEGSLTISSVFGLQAKLTPVSSTGRWSGRHTVRLANWGNAPLRLRLAAADPDERLAFLIEPAVIDLPLGATATCQLRVRTRRPFLRGAPVRLPFQVVAEADSADQTAEAPSHPSDPRRQVLDGALNQRPILSRGTVALAGIAALALAGTVAVAVTHNSKQPPLDEILGAPDQPVLQASTNPDGTIRLYWEPVSQVTSYKLTRDPATSEQIPPVPGTRHEYVTGVLAPDTSYCFDIVAIRGGMSSAPSKKVCASLPAPTPSTSATASSSTPPDPARPLEKGEFIAWIGHPHLDTTANAEKEALDEANAFFIKGSLGYIPYTLHTKTLKGLKVFSPDGLIRPLDQWIVYVRASPAWTNPDELLSWCQKSTDAERGTCVPVLPKP